MYNLVYILFYANYLDLTKHKTCMIRQIKFNLCLISDYDDYCNITTIYKINDSKIVRKNDGL